MAKRTKTKISHLMKRLNYKNGNALRICAAVVIVGLWWFFSSSELSYTKPIVDLQRSADDLDTTPQRPGQEKSDAEAKSNEKKKILQDNSLGTIMPSMPEQDAKEALGRASWKYFHTLLARFPDEPTDQEKTKLRDFIYLYAELYPCGECSYHFVKMLKKNPPQVSSRTAAAMWGCNVHNIVNEYLKKPRYDCTTILEDYDCGCGDDDGKIKEGLKLNKVTVEKEGKQGG